MKEPKQTCPAINAHIKTIKDLADDVRGITDLFEDLRKANEEIREWGQYWKDEAEKHQKIITELEEENEKLREGANQ